MGKAPGPKIRKKGGACGAVGSKSQKRAKAPAAKVKKCDFVFWARVAH